MLAQADPMRCDFQAAKGPLTLDEVKDRLREIYERHRIY